MKKSDIVKIEPTDQVVPIKRARYWVQAVEYQARRVIELHASPVEHQTPLAMEGQFLLNAVAKAIRWLDAAQRSGVSTDVKQSIEAFKEKIDRAGDTKMLRDFREHDDEYDLGAGRQRHKIPHIAQCDDREFEVCHRVNVTYRDGAAAIGDLLNLEGLHILLGGRFDVVPARDAAEQLAAFLIGQENITRPDNPIPLRFDGPNLHPAVERGC